MRYVYPFTAIIGQEKMKLALILNAVNPRIGGVLIRGEKGTAKSTAVRALASLLPEIEVVAGCPCNCDPQEPARLCPFCRERLAAGEPLSVSRRPVPVVDLPVSATEDRVVGSLDFEHAVRHGRRRFEPGILARANRGIVYVDEVNLLDDHLVDLVLDAAASGVNVVEREGVSFVHPARFILVGTMNPEEGELRPQLLDRFGLCVPVKALQDPAERAALIRQREAFEAGPQGFIRAFAAQEEEMRQQIAAARARLAGVAVLEGAVKRATEVAAEALCAGHRAEIVLVEAARALAAWEGRAETTTADVGRVAELVLFHRRREALPPQPLEEALPEEPEEPQQFEEPEEPAPEEKPRPEEPEAKEGRQEEHWEDGKGEEGEASSPPPAPARETVFAVGEPFLVKRIDHGRDRILRKGSGRRSRTRTPTRAGRYVRATLARGSGDLAFDATLRAAAPYQAWREKKGVAIAIETPDIREKVREKRIGDFLLFVVDASGSMGAAQRMVAAKGAVLSLLFDAYQKRDRVGMIAFKGEGAQLLLPPTNSVELAHRCLQELPTGGRTPLAAGLLKAYEVARAHLFKNPHLSPLLVIISDGRGNVGLANGKPLEDAWRVADLIREEERIKSVVVDAEKEGFLHFGLARRLAETLGAAYYRIEDLRATTLVEAVRTLTD
ncbi:MAG: putative cobaltochelatase [Clostridia bacterium]|nr:putative cobaltochelatase [Clostridia bacterium]